MPRIIDTGSVIKAVELVAFMRAVKSRAFFEQMEGCVRCAGDNEPIRLHVDADLGSNGHLCYIAKGTVVLDIFDPVGQSLACLKRAEEILDKVLKGELVEDLEEEFYTYWNGPWCLVDMQDQRLGRQETLVIKPRDDFTVVVTDDRAWTTKKLKCLGWEASDITMITYRVRTSAMPRVSRHGLRLSSY